ncbi:MAG: VCBS repeat-containing protein [Spirochaetes bacterium]|nr:VCBS repeat-containing protein [Spirochaetota bacterium]
MRCLLIIILIFTSNLYARFTNWYDLSPDVYYSSVVLGDIDSNGTLDLVLMGWDGGSSHFKVYKNNGSGVLSEFQNISPVANNGDIALGDIDSDNDLDLIMTGIGAGTYFKIYTNNGVGNFYELQDISPGIYDSDLSLGDIDMDGDLDIVVIGNDGGTKDLKIYTNNGYGNFSNAQQISLNIDEGDLNLGDIDSDGDFDIVIIGKTNVGGPPPRIFQFYTNNGNGNFNLFNNINPGIFEGDMVFGDVDGDNDIDLVIAGYMGGSDTLSFTNNGTGIFNQYQDIALAATDGSISLGDIDSDGDLDLIVTGGGNFNVYTNNGYGLYYLYHSLNPGVQYSSIQMGDIDSDNDIDLVMTGGSGFGPYTPHSKVYRNLNLINNNPPLIPSGMQLENFGGYWRMKWSPGSDDHTPKNLLRYKIAIGTNQTGVYDYISEVIDYPRGQANIGNIPQGWITPSQCYYQSKIPTTKHAFWKVCSIDSAFKNSDFCKEQADFYFYSRITKIDPSEGIYFGHKGKIIGEARSTGQSGYELEYIEVRIKDLNKGTFWDGVEWTSITNTWHKASGKDYWEYDCGRVNWDLGSKYYAESRPVNALGHKGMVNDGIEFMVVARLSEYSFCNYPNPFDPNRENTCIEYLLTSEENVKVYIYTMSGKLVNKWEFTKGNEGARQGINKFFWDGRYKSGRIVENGVYFSYLITENDKKLNKIAVVK